MTQTGGLVILYAWLIFAGLLTVLAYLLLRHEQDPLQDLTRPDQDDHDQAKSLPVRAGRTGHDVPAPGIDAHRRLDRRHDPVRRRRSRLPQRVRWPRAREVRSA